MYITFARVSVKLIPDSPMTKQSPTPRRPAETREALIDAAWSAFEEDGYDETNSNKIAARAGFAPQTFYRHFENKAAIFLAVYARWVREEQAALDDLRDAEKAARFAIRHHRRSRNFRRALRQLSLSEPSIRAARAASRRAQIAQLRMRLSHLSHLDDADLAARLLTIERLTDACAEGEFADLGVSAAAAEALLANALRAAFGRAKR